MQVVTTVITILVILSIVTFLLYVVSILRLPTGRRPRTPTYDRFGDPLPAEVNPGFAETEDEEEAADSSTGRQSRE